MRVCVRVCARVCAHVHVCVCVCVCVCTLFWLWHNPFKTVVIQGLCDLPELILIEGTTPVPIISLNQPLCFGCIFRIGFTVLAVPFGTEWFFINGNITTPLTNNTEGVTLSSTNGTVLIESPSSLLVFDMSQIVCNFTNGQGIDVNVASVTQASKFCLPQFTCMAFWQWHCVQHVWNASCRYQCLSCLHGCVSRYSAHCVSVCWVATARKSNN